MEKLPKIGIPVIVLFTLANSTDFKISNYD